MRPPLLLLFATLSLLVGTCRALRIASGDAGLQNLVLVDVADSASDADERPPTLSLIQRGSEAVPVPPPTDDPHYKLQYQQLPKTGLSAIHSVLFHVVTNYSFVPGGILGRRPYKGVFLVGSIRNPCDWYVSTWAFAVESMYSGRLDRSAALWKDLFSYEGESARHMFNATKAKNTTEDIAAFREFVRHTAGKASENISDPVGVYTGRFAQAYLGRGNKSGLSVIPGLTSKLWNAARFPDSTHRLVRDRLERPESLSDFDCWVKTETLYQDLRVCLKKFETERGAGVNWELFEDIAADRTRWVGKQKVGRLRDNSSPHGSCKAYFDPETEKLVRQRDDVIFKMFGYESCCAHK